MRTKTSKEKKTKDIKVLAKDTVVKQEKPKRQVTEKSKDVFDKNISKAIVRFVRVSPRKARQVIDLIRGKNVINAQAILLNLNRRATKPVGKVLKSAIDNAKFKTENKVDQSKLYISKIWADTGPMLKRFKAQAMGRATTIRRRMSHIGVELTLK